MNNIVVATSFDENYMDYSKVMLRSLDSNLNYTISVYCLVPEYLLENEFEYISSIKPVNMQIKFISSEKFNKLNCFSTGERFTKNSWHRCFLSTLLPDKDKVIYVDPDIIFMRDASPLLSYKTTMPVAAYVEEDFQDHSLEVFGSQDYIYFNDGVFIADLNYWRSHNIEDEIVDYAINNSTRFIEQDAMNYVFRGLVEPLPVTFNFFVNKAELYYSVSDPMIIHFSCPEKPWSHDIDNPYYRIWKKIYKSLTE